jgi:hypothetical protein
MFGMNHTQAVRTGHGWLSLAPSSGSYKNDSVKERNGKNSSRHVLMD